MKKIISKVLSILVTVVLTCLFSINTFAEEATTSGTSIRLEPVSKILQISSNSTYNENFEVFNDGEGELKIEVYAAPYSYVYSDEEDLYKLGFSNENNFTQISRWISFDDGTGSYIEKPVFTINPNSSVVINFRVTTPNNIPAGGQYGVIFAHTLNSVASSSGIRTEASPGIVLYARSNEGEAVISAEISDLKIEQSINENNITRNHFFASAKVKNTGNVDFTATGKMKVEPIIGSGSYETAENAGRLSVIPEAELTLTDEWAETPSFGIYKVTWTVTAGNSTETIERTIFLIPVWLIILTIIVLTILIIWIIIGVRKRKERRSRLAV